MSDNISENADPINFFIEGRNGYISNQAKEIGVNQ